ncbi:MAG: tRNA threonylcarbamoyladenosine biosynthesis protein TsaE [Candidatus Atribacteria bacterium]|nr:tRNA threonylcarbamoyladenosine biosynthesis protein TsaE [Candidatus Atribacteria bacterium]
MKRKIDFFLSRSPEETQNFGREIVKGLAREKNVLLLLQGDLGVGKTCLVKGIASGLGISPDEVVSPTFSLINEYRSSQGKLFHMDFYRLDLWQEVVDLGIEEYFEKEGIIAVEWGDKFIDYYPRPFWVISFNWVGEREREITVTRWEKEKENS